jgi:hypothetical protein
MKEKPTVAFILTMLGGVLILLAVPILFLKVYVTEVYFLEPMREIKERGWLIPLIMFSVILSIPGIITIIGALMIKSSDKEGVKNGGILVAIVSAIWLYVTIVLHEILLGPFYIYIREIPLREGFVIGSIIALIGGVIALFWKPHEISTHPASTSLS